MNVRQYRPEIDGLRALSVLGVVFFHLGISVPGGFVGVDVFFVISGYLITGILLRNLREGRFSLVDFWSRRVRRIAPAAVAMVLGTLALGGYLLTPAGFESLGRTLVAHVLFASNCYFSQDQGYFAESADALPLLHTWSLAVEEQFYVILPLVLMVVWKWRPRWIMPVMVGLAIWSLGWSHFKVQWNVKEAFFLLPPRGWELMAGAILAGLPSFNLKPLFKEFLSSLGLALIVVPMMFYGKETVFPGLGAVPPVLGAVLFILANERGQTGFGRLLSLRPVVLIGLMSYSLYLWHWPLFVFAKMVNHEFTTGWQVAVLAASFVMGWLSWKFVETPFRTGGFLKTARRSLAFAGVTMTVLLAVAAGMQLSGGFPQRFSSEVRVMMEDVDWEGAELTAGEEEPVGLGGLDSEWVDFVLWGDSHGVAATPGLAAAARKTGMHGWAFLNNGTPPLTGVFTADMGEEAGVEMVEMNERILRKIIASGTKNLILASRWVSRCEGYNEVEMRGFPHVMQKAPMLVERENPDPGFEESAGLLRSRLVEMSARLKGHGIELWVLQQVPESTVGKVAERFYAATRFPLLYSLEERDTSLEVHQVRERRTMAEFVKLPAGTVRMIDATGAFYPEGANEGLKLFAERAYYRDDDHLSRFGSVHYLAPVFEEVLLSMRGE
ncbi:MAG: acyltransferase family protein [Akkermansiaceae bacterium]|jgi:peptidoglycan/LPS O-acetylase OafA/YrhL